MENNKLSALQTTVLVAVSMFMVGKALVEIYVMIGKLALRLGRQARVWYTGSRFQTPVVNDAIEAVNVEAVEVRKAAGTYLCGWMLVASTVHAGYIYLRNFDYVASVELETKVREYMVDKVEWYVQQWKQVLA